MHEADTQIPLLFQMYMISVLWSDQNEIVVHRTLEDFEKMHVSTYKRQITETHITEACEYM